MQLFRLEFHNYSYATGQADESAYETECNVCGSEWAGWGSYDSVDACIAEAEKKNAEWRDEGGHVLRYRVIVECFISTESVFVNHQR